MEYTTIEELYKAYGVDENTEKVGYDDIHTLLPIDKVNELLDKYILTWFPDGNNCYYLLPKEG